MTHTTSRPSLRWTLTGELTEAARAALADVLDCAFTDETQERPGFMAAPDVTFVAAPDEHELRVLAHFNDRHPAFSTEQQWLDERVRQAAAAARLSVTAGPQAVGR